MGRESKCGDRIARLRKAIDRAILIPEQTIVLPKTLVGVTCSRLGYDWQLHRHVCKVLTRCLVDCRRRDATILVASGSAIEEWAVRAADLFGVPSIKLSVSGDSHKTHSDVTIRSEGKNSISRDAAVIALADHVDACYVRRNGEIERCLTTRVEDCRDTSTRVALCPIRKCAARKLIQVGAIGWYHPSAPNEPPMQRMGPLKVVDGLQDSSVGSDSWTRAEGKWLIHCTRQPKRAWPDETERQYLDSLLLSDETIERRGPLDALIRITRSGRLVASAIATSKSHPVVCFSSLSLQDLLQRRCYRPHLRRWDYEPFGIAIRRSAATRLGIQPVVYGAAKDRALLSPAQRFRFHPAGTTYDWREEQEWRSDRTVELQSIDRNDVRVFAVISPESVTRLRNCRWPVTWISPVDGCESETSDQPIDDLTNQKKRV